MLHFSIPPRLQNEQDKLVKTRTEALSAYWQLLLAVAANQSNQIKLYRMEWNGVD